MLDDSIEWLKINCPHYGTVGHDQQTLSRLNLDAAPWENRSTREQYAHVLAIAKEHLSVVKEAGLLKTEGCYKDNFEILPVATSDRQHMQYLLSMLDIDLPDESDPSSYVDLAVSRIRRLKDQRDEYKACYQALAKDL